MQETPDPHLFPPQEPPAKPLSDTANQFIGCAVVVFVVGLSTFGSLVMTYALLRGLYRLIF